MSVRSSQRAPRACQFCSARKIKCDKELPCGECRARGQADRCAREPVIVKGRIVRGESAPPQPSYSELVVQVQGLQREIDRQRLRSDHSSDDLGSFPNPEKMNMMDEHEQRLYRAIKYSKRESSVVFEHNIILPSPECAANILQSGPHWMWLHMAVDAKHFEAEIRVYQKKCRVTHPTQAAENSWLALYFAYLTATLLLMTEEERSVLNLPYGDSETILRNWMDASLFFLEKAQFMRILDVRNVQAIAILCQCFAYFADFNLYYTLLACAVRICQSLEINVDNARTTETNEEAQVRRRLWWSLVICDWMTFQLGANCIKREDCKTKTPEILKTLDKPLGIPFDFEFATPVQWQIVMVRVCYSLYRFQASLPYVKQDVELLLTAMDRADNELAEIVSQLPPHLSANEEITPLSLERDAQHPWIPWQKLTITIILLYYRIVVNRVYTKYHASPEVSPSLWRKRSFAVCTDSAHLLISTLLDSNENVSRPRIWYLLLPLYSAATTLVAYSEHCRCGTVDFHKLELRRCVTFLETIGRGSIYACHAAKALRDIIE